MGGEVPTVLMSCHHRSLFEPFTCLEELVEILVLVRRLHHPDALLSQPSHDGEEGELGILPCRDLLIDGDSRVDQCQCGSGPANSSTAMDQKPLSLVARLLGVLRNERGRL